MSDEPKNSWKDTRKYGVIIIKKMEIEAYIVNAFAEEIAHGNQAGVVFVEKELSERTMQKIAFDIGKSETAFVRKHDNQYFIRWFSPLKETHLYT